jgi:NTE family protein
MRFIPPLAILYFLLSGTLHAQKAPIENLVFEGAGIRGIAFSGAISELEERKILPGIKRVGGTSAGAITALMISLGYTAAEIETIIGRTNFRKFNDGKFFFPGGVARLRNHFGWYQGRKFEAWLEEIIQAKTGHKNTSFWELKASGFKDLYITGTNLNDQKLVVFSHETFPAMKVKDAVRISVSIPLYFEPLFMNEEGVMITRPKDKKPLKVMVDGGFIANFPIRIFDSSRFAGGTNNVFIHNTGTIGFRIDRKDQIENDQQGKGLVSLPVNNLEQYIAAFYNLVIENLNRQTLTPEDWQRTVSISDGAIGPRIRKLKREEINVLVNNGREATRKFLDR